VSRVVGRGEFAEDLRNTAHAETTSIRYSIELWLEGERKERERERERQRTVTDEVHTRARAHVHTYSEVPPGRREERVLRARTWPGKNYPPRVHVGDCGGARSSNFFQD